MRKKSSKKSRSNTQLDLRKMYANGLNCDVFAPIELASPSETEFEILFCESILRTDSSHYEAMVALGDAYTRIGEFQKGLEVDLKLNKLKPEDEMIRYNLACSFALTGQIEKALNSLAECIALGYKDAEHLRKDHDLDILHGHPKFEEMVRALSEQRAQTA